MKIFQVRSSPWLARRSLIARLRGLHTFGQKPYGVEALRRSGPFEADVLVRKEEHTVKWPPWKKLVAPAAGPALSPSLTAPAGESNKQFFRGLRPDRASTKGAAMPLVRRASLRLLTTCLVATMLAVGPSATGWSTRASADTMTPLDASQIVADMGAGWNLGNSLEANSNGYPSETAWNNPAVTQALIDRVHAAGFKTIRIPVSYLNAIGSGPNYTIDSSWLNRVQEVVDYAYDRGMYVVINMHGDGFKSVTGSWLICDGSDQTTIRAKYQKAWQQIATRFQGYDEHLILESMNEEFDGQHGEPTQPCYSNINSYNQIFVDTVRQAGGNNSSRWLLVPGWNTNIDYTTGDYGFVIPTDGHRSPSIPGDEQRIMISVHYYDPWDFAGEENGTITQWGPGATDPSKTSTWGQEDHMDTQLKKTYDAFVTRGYPVVVGEYGAIDKSSHDSANNRYRQDFAHTLVATAKKYGASTIYWDNGINGQNGFGLFDRSSGSVTQQGIVDGIMSALGTSG